MHKKLRSPSRFLGMLQIMVTMRDTPIRKLQEKGERMVYFDIPAKKTVANASEAHMPHFKWLGIICESVECTALTLATFAANIARSSGKISFVGRIAFNPNVPCSNSIGKCDWLQMEFDVNENECWHVNNSEVFQLTIDE